MCKRKSWMSKVTDIDRHNTHTEDSFIMVHGMLDIMSPPWRLSVCGSQCGHIHVKTRTDEQYMGKT